MGEKYQDTVVITGFGPFRDHPVNASWEAVKLVPSPHFEAELQAHVVIDEMPVDYTYVSKRVPHLWKKHKPALVVHVGVSRKAQCITLEKWARNIGYNQVDIHNQMPEIGKCCRNGPNCIQCTLDLKHIAKQVETCTGVKAGLSYDAGQYLCEYTYYLSLNEDPSSAVFIHVPALDQKYSVGQLAAAIKVVVSESLGQSRKLRANKLLALDACQ